MWGENDNLKREFMYSKKKRKRDHALETLSYHKTSYSIIVGHQRAILNSNISSALQEKNKIKKIKNKVSRVFL